MQVDVEVNWLSEDLDLAGVYQEARLLGLQRVGLMEQIKVVREAD